MKKNKLRPLGDIQLDIEPYILEMDDHNLQWGDYMGLLYLYLKIHLPNAQEEYYDGTSPIFFYGHKETFLKEAEKLKKS